MWLFSTSSVRNFSPHSYCGSFPTKSEFSHQSIPKSQYSYPNFESLLREANWRPSLLLSGSSLLSLYSGCFCLLWVLVVEIALNSQPVSGSAPHIGLVGCSCPCEYQYNRIPFQKSCRFSAVFFVWVSTSADYDSPCMELSWPSPS